MLRNGDTRWGAISGKTGNGVIGTISKILEAAALFHKLQPSYIWSRLGWEGNTGQCQELGLLIQPIRHAE